MKKEKGTWKRVLAKILVFSLVFQLAMPVMAAPAVEEVVAEDATPVVEEVAEEAMVEESAEVAEEAVDVEEALKDSQSEGTEEEVTPEGEEEITLTIDGYGDITGFTGTLPETLVIPEEINGTTVTGIKEGVFEGQLALKHVELPNTLEYLDGFKGCTNLETVSLPKATIDLCIYSEAFKDCKNLIPLSFEDVSSVQIYGYAFAGCEKFKDYDWVLSSGTSHGTIYLYSNAFAGFKVNSLTIAAHVDVYTGGDSVFGTGDEAFENITNVYNVDSWVSCDFEQFASATPGATVVINEPDGADDFKNFDVPGVKEIQIAPNEIGWQVIDGVVYGPLENNPNIRVQYMCKYAELENGVYYLPDDIDPYYTFWQGNNIVKELVLPDSMTTISSTVQLNSYPVTVHLPKDTSVNRIFYDIASTQSYYKDKQAEITVVLPSTLDNYTIKTFRYAPYADKVVVPSDMTVFDAAKISAMFEKPEIILAEDHPTLMKVGNSIYSKDGKTLYWWGDSLNQGDKVEIPEGVETIAPHAVRVSTSIQPITVTLPSSLKHYEKDAVYAKDADLRLVTTECSDDVTVEPSSFVVKYLFVNNPETSPFVEAWGTDKIGKVISGGVASVKINVFVENENGTAEKAPYGVCKVSLSKNTDDGVVSAKSECTYLEDGSVEVLLTESGNYIFEFEPLIASAYFPATVEGVELSLVSREEANDNVTEVTVTLKRRPALRVETDIQASGYIYDADGKRLSSLSSREYGLISTSLAPGTYKVMIHKASNKIKGQANLDEYFSLGYFENQDYLIKELVIAEDVAEDVVWNLHDDPNFNQLKDIHPNFLNNVKSSYTASAMDARMGYTNLNIEYEIDREKWDASAETVNIMVTLPEGVTYIENSASYKTEADAQNSQCTAKIDGNIVTFTLDKESLKGKILFSVKLEDGANGVSTACIKGTETNYIGAVEFGNSQLTINAPAQFSKNEGIELSGKGKAGGTVELFVGNAKVGEAVVDDSGMWSTDISISNAVEGSSYLITACLTGKIVGVDSVSDETWCVEKPIKVTNIAYEYYGNIIKSSVDMSKMVGKQTVSTRSYGWYPFYLFVDIRNDENIQELYIAYDRGNGREYEKLVQEETGKWALYTSVCSSGLPNDLTIVAKVKNGDEVKEIDICDFVIKWCIDPSGYIYEVVPENRVEGATVTTYYKDEDGNAVKWNAEEFTQINPVISDGDGNYGWFVPAGQWKVVAEKVGYTKAESDWLPVPPPQLDVNLELVSTKQPKVAGIDLASDKMLVRFDNYVLADSFTKENVALKDATDKAVEIASVEAVDAKERNEKAIAKEFIVTFVAPLAEGSYTATVAAGVTSYADVVMNESQELTGLAVAGIINDIETPEFFVVQRGKQCTFEVDVLSDESTQDRVLTAISADDSKIKIASVGKVNAQGKATITLDGQSAGVTEVTLGVENSSFTKTVSVMVIDNETVFDKMFEQNNLAKPQVSDKNNNENKPSVDITKAVVTGIENKVYTGTAITQEVKVTVDGKVLVKDTDYTVTYKNNTEAGTAEVVITGKGNYKGTKTLSFTIDKADTTARFEKDVYKKAYGAKKFTVKVVDAAGAVTFKSSSSKVAKIDKKGKVTIKGTGRAVITATIAESKNYKAGTVETVIEVSPKKASIKKLSAKKTQLTVTWKKDKRATGYEVKYSTSKKFKKAKTVLVKKTKTTKTTLKKLKKGKTYYVKVRAYKEVKVGNKKVKIYSPYSKTLKKKIK